MIWILFLKDLSMANTLDLLVYMHYFYQSSRHFYRTESVKSPHLTDEENETQRVNGKLVPPR